MNRVSMPLKASGGIKSKMDEQAASRVIERSD